MRSAHYTKLFLSPYMNNIISSFIQDIWVDKNLDNIERYIAPDYVAYALKGKTTVNGVAGVRNNIENTLKKYPDFILEIDDMFGDESKIVTRLKFKPLPSTQRKKKVEKYFLNSLLSVAPRCTLLVPCRVAQHSMSGSSLAAPLPYCLD